MGLDIVEFYWEICKSPEVILRIYHKRQFKVTSFTRVSSLYESSKIPLDISVYDLKRKKRSENKQRNRPIDNWDSKNSL